MSLLQIVYISRTSVPPAEMTRQVEDILRVSRTNNPRDGVTGALLVSESGFAQVLEGPPDAVETVFERIQCDPRHDEVVVLTTQTATERNFGGWSMAMCDGAEALLQAGTSLEQLAQQGSGGAAQTVELLLGALHRDGLRARRQPTRLDAVSGASYLST